MRRCFQNPLALAMGRFSSQLQIHAHGEYAGTWEVSVEMLHAPGEALPAELRAPHLNS